MHGQQSFSRKKLSPKKPIKKVVKNRKTFHTQNAWEQTLTEHQQAWARSLAVSLSGWRSRQRFLKDRLEVHLQAETQLKAVEAEHEAQRAAEEKEKAKVEATLQAEADEEYAEKAAAWENKAWKMHQAGRGVGKEKHRYFGWDVEKEEYPRNVELENLIAERKARRKAKFKADWGFSDSENSDDTNSDSSDGLQIEVSDAPTRRSLQPPPIVERAPVVDWREKARTGITKKKLSVTKRWSAVTWNQKSNIQERLLVLEEDGYDIQELQDRKATSEEVTNIILKRAAAIQQSDAPAGQLSPQSDQSVSEHGRSESLSPVWFDPALRKSASESLTQTPSPNIPPTTKTPAGCSPLFGDGSKEQHVEAKTFEDKTQPFSLDEPYHPQPSHRLKRKRDDDIESDTEYAVVVSLPVSKKRKVDHVTAEGLASRALQEIKRTVFRRVFRAVRSLGQKPMAPSRIVFSTPTRISPVDATETETKTQKSTLSYLYPRTSRVKPESQSYSISSCGFDHMMNELRFLTDTTDEYSAMHIYDPDYDEDLTYTLVRAEERIKQNRRRMQRQTSRMVVSTNEHGHTVFQGDAMILAELLKVLREQALLHCVNWEWDGLRLQRSNDLLWSLSPQTQKTFIDIENRLRGCSRTGIVEIVVDRVDGVRADCL